MACLRERAYNLGRRTYDAQHASFWVNTWHVVLLNGAQCLGRGSVTSQNDEMASHIEKPDDGLPRELVDYIE